MAAGGRHRRNFPRAGREGRCPRVSAPPEGCLPAPSLAQKEARGWKAPKVFDALAHPQAGVPGCGDAITPHVIPALGRSFSRRLAGC